jgi:uncharacterized membrane protein (DUF4010 family)
LAASGSLVQRYVGDWGFWVVSAMDGFISSASTTATAAILVGAGKIAPETAGFATVLTSMTSALVNMPLVYQQTRQRRMTRRLAFISVAIVVVGLCALGFGAQLSR